MKKFLLLTILILLKYPVRGQNKNKDTTKFELSGTLNVNTNGISPVPAFSLDKPSVIGSFSLSRKRLAFTPEAAFSLKAKPWFISPRFTYRAINGKKFSLDISTAYTFNYTYPEEFLNGRWQTSTTVEHYILLQSASTYRVSKKTSISLITFHGFGQKLASIKRGNFFVLGGKIVKMKITENLYHSLFPQLVYVNMDGATDGLFVSGIYGIGHKKLPFFLSTQLTQPLATNISPNPGFKWNLGLSFIF